jgi:hypothetical protein
MCSTGLLTQGVPTGPLGTPPAPSPHSLKRTENPPGSLGPPDVGLRDQTPLAEWELSPQVFKHGSLGQGYYADDAQYVSMLKLQARLAIPLALTCRLARQYAMGRRVIQTPPY